MGSIFLVRPRPETWVQKQQQKGASLERDYFRQLGHKKPHAEKGFPLGWATSNSSGAKATQQGASSVHPACCCHSAWGHWFNPQKIRVYY
jgi:hypothetical protein